MHILLLGASIAVAALALEGFAFKASLATSHLFSAPSY